MSAQMVMSGMGGENRQFTAAVVVSLLLHLGVLWFGQNLSSQRGEQGTASVYNTIEVALVARAAPERVVAQVKPRPLETVTQVPESTVTHALNEQVTSAPDADVATDNLAEGGTSEASESTAQRGGAVNAGVRDRYLAIVLAHIESHKFYPLLARRRGLQGQVDVRFILDARGMISDLDVTGSNSLFVEAARAAVRSAVPLPAASSSDGFPLSVRYQMIFKLQ